MHAPKPSSETTTERESGVRKEWITQCQHGRGTVCSNGINVAQFKDLAGAVLARLGLLALAVSPTAICTAGSYHMTNVLKEDVLQTCRPPRTAWVALPAFVSEDQLHAR